MSIVANWKLNGNANDALGVNNGTPTDITYKQGIENQAAIFNGTTSKILLASNAALNLTNIFSISLIMRQAANTKNQMLIGSQKYYIAGFNGNWILRSGNTTRIDFASYNGTANEEYNTFTFPNFQNNYRHLVITCNGTVMRAFMDSKESTDGAKAHTKSLIAGSVSGLIIGNITRIGNVAYNGLQDDVRIFNHVLSQTEMKNIMMYYKGFF